MNTTTLHPHERTYQLIWTGIILSFFLIQAVIWTVAFSITANDRSHVVLADYDQKSLNWDKEQAVRRASLALGWQSVLTVDTTGDIRGNRVLTLTLHDRAGQPVDVAAIDLSAFHRGQAADVQQLRLKRIGPGEYATTVRVRKSGQWQFTGSVRNEDDEFLVDERLVLAK
jgi:nitrogen fixation protein FixH